VWCPRRRVAQRRPCHHHIGPESNISKLTKKEVMKKTYQTSPGPFPCPAFVVSPPPPCVCHGRRHVARCRSRAVSSSLCGVLVVVWPRCRRPCHRRVGPESNVSKLTKMKKKDLPKAQETSTTSSWAFSLPCLRSLAAAAVCVSRSSSCGPGVVVVQCRSCSCSSKCI
jgi:hypothetical protein